MGSKNVLAVLVLAACAYSPFALGANSGVTYQGRILKPDGSALSGQFTQFRLQIRTPDSQNCLMYEEVQSQDLRNSGGLFSLTINDGTGSRTDTTGWTLDRIFANRGSLTFDPATCSTGPGSYTPNPADGRNLVVLFKDETMATWEPIPAQKINFVPFAFEAKQVAGFSADSLLRVVGPGGDPLTGVSPLSNAQYNELLALLNGTSTQFTKSGQLNGVALPTMSAGEVLGWNGSAWVSQTASGGPNSVTTTMIQNAAIDSSKIATGAVGATQIANNAVGSAQIANGAVGTSQIAGNVSINTTGTLGSAITTTRDFKIYAASPSTFYVGMLADPALSASYILTWPLTAGLANQVLTTDGSGKLTWTSPSSAGITDLTGDVTATGPGSAAATVASVGGSTAAQVHLAELAANAATALNTPNTIVKRDGTGGFTAGDITASNVKTDTLQLNNAGSIVHIVNPTGAAYTLTLPTGTGTNGQVLATNGSGATSWTSALTSTTGFVQGGNAFGAVANLGTNDNFGLNIKTNNSTAMTVASDGKVGIGTTSPTRALDVVTGAASDTVVVKNTHASGWSDIVFTNAAGASQLELGYGNPSASMSPNANFLYTVKDFSIMNGSSTFLIVRPSAGNVGIGTTSPVAKLEVAGSFRVGDGGETCDASLTGAIRYNGGNLQFCAGSMPWTTLGAAGSGLTALTGDVTATGPGSATATVALVGGSTAANVHSAELLANAATDANTASTIVKRDGSGNFSAGAISVGSVSSSSTVTATGAISGASVAVTGAVTAATITASGAVTQGSAVFKDSGSNTVTVQAPTTVSSSYVLKWPTSAGGSDEVLKTDASGNLSWTALPTALPPNGAAGGDLIGNYPNPTVATVGTSTAANIHSAELLANAATAANTSNAIVKRDGTGNFTASDITASNVKTDTLKLNNSGSVVNIVNPIGAAYTLALPATVPSVNGQVLSSTTAGVTSWVTAGLTHFTEAVSTAAPNATIPVVSLSATDAATNVDMALVPKGTGALTAQVADGVTAGGNKRGPNAVDFQMIRTTATQVASGAASVLVGGLNNTNAGVAAFLGGGYGNTITSGGSYGVIVAGDANQLSGSRSSILNGDTNVVSGQLSTILNGSDNNVTSSYSLIGGGSDNGITGSYGLIGTGNNNTVSNSYGLVLGGFNNTSSAMVATVLGGFYNTASGTGAVVLGGSYGTASGANSATMGNYVTAESYLQTTFGQYNLPKGSETAGSWVATDPLFVIGNGTGSGASRSTAVMVLKNGNVGIGTTNPGQALEVNGSILASAFLYSSDERLKKDIEPLDRALQNVLRLRGVGYDWRRPVNEEQKRHQIGVIAQDVEKVYPEAVTKDATGTLRVNYPSLIAPVIEAIRELFEGSQAVNEKVQRLENRVDELERENKVLADELERKKKDFEARLQSIERRLSRRPASR